MKVKDLVLLLAELNQESEVVIYDNGSILKTASKEDTDGYNQGSTTDEFYIVTTEWGDADE